MKYEMIFGNQELFDNAPLGTELVGHSGGFYKNSPDGPIYCGGCTFTTDEYRNIGFIAARRVIAEPKRWTAEDQKAGRLPEVGAEFKTSIGKRKCVITEGKFIFTVYDGSVEVFTIDSAMPLETPEEKAERLRSEWCAKAAKTLKNIEYTSTLTSIYEALLSGELPTPKKDD